MKKDFKVPKESKKKKTSSSSSSISSPKQVSNPPPTSDLISLGDSTGNEVEFGAFQGQSNSLPSFPFSNKGIGKLTFFFSLFLNLL